VRAGICRARGMTLPLPALFSCALTSLLWRRPQARGNRRAALHPLLRLGRRYRLLAGITSTTSTWLRYYNAAGFHLFSSVHHCLAHLSRALPAMLNLPHCACSAPRHFCAVLASAALLYRASITRSYISAGSTSTVRRYILYRDRSTPC